MRHIGPRSPRRRWRRAAAAGCLLAGVWSLVAAAQVPAQDRAVPLRRAYVPLDRPPEWPAGDWVPVPIDALKHYLLDEANPAGAAPVQPYFEHVDIEAALGPDLALQGAFRAVVVRPPAAGEFLETGPVTAVLSELSWPDGPAVWGTAEDERVLLAVPRAAQILSGRWSLPGQSQFGRVQYQMALPAAESTRCRITTPASWRLTSSAGIVSREVPVPATDDGAAAPAADHVVWTVELGHQRECTWFLEPAADSAAGVALQCERTLAYLIRPRGCRVQADFVVHSLGPPPGELIFRAPAGLTNVAATYSSSLIPLRVEAASEGAELRIAVPLHVRERGRLGTFRIVGDLPVAEAVDWPLPAVSLEGAVLVRGTRRVSVDRPLALLNVGVEGLRESGVASDELGTSWLYEELRSAATLTVRIVRPQTLLSAAVLTRIWSERQWSVFHAAASLEVRAGSSFQAAFAIPPGWEVIDVLASPGSVGSGISSWRVEGSGEGSRLHVDFRQALQAQSSKQIEILGRTTAPADTEQRVPALPIPESADRWELLLAVEPAAGGAFRATGGLTPFEMNPADLGAQRSAQLAALRLAAGDRETKWFRADSESGGGELVLELPSGEPPSGAGAAPPPPATPTGAAPLHLTLALRSILADSGDLHEAHYRLSGAPTAGPLEFQLGEGAVLDTVLVEGAGHATSLHETTVELAPLPSTAREVVVRYRTSGGTRSGFLRRRVEVPLPQWNVPVAGLHWELHVPPDLSLLETSLPSAVWSPDRTLTWTQRLFAPLARRPDAPRFDPLSENDWRQLARELWDPSPPDGGGDAAANDQQLTAAGPVPGVVRLELGHHREAANLGRVGLFGALLLVAGLRRRSGRRGKLALSAAAVGLLFASLAVPACYAPLAGGGFTGMLGGMLLPASWIARRDVLAGWAAPRERSGLRVARSAGAAGLVLALLMDSLPARSQEAPRPATNELDRATGSDAAPPTPRDAGAPAGRAGDEFPFDVLLPYSGTDLGPVGYLARRHIEDFRGWYRARHERPAYLLRSARYVPDPADAAAVRAEIDVVVLAAARRVPVLLRFGDAVFRNPDDCLVDGRREQVRPAVGGEGFVVDVEGAAPSGEDASAASSARSTKLTLWLRSPDSDAARRGALDLAIPRVIDAQIVMGENDLRGASLAGGSDRLRLWPPPAVDGAVEGPPDVTAQAVSMIEVHPLWMQVRTELLLASSTAGRALPRRLQLQLPRGADVRQVAAEGLRRFTAWHAEPHATLLEVEFDRAPVPGQTVEFDYAAPLREASLQVETPAIPLLPEGGLVSHRIGLRAAPGLVLEPQRRSLPPGRVQELLPDLFSAGLSSGAVWPAADAAFSVPLPTPLPVQLSPLQPSRSAALQQTIVVERAALRLDAAAQVEISGGRVFRHEFSAPPGLRIDSVSVVQDGANRLRDWVRHEDHVVLHLQDGRTGVQEIRVRGWMPLDPEAATPLPYLTLVDADLRLSELLLRNASGEPVALTSREGAAIEPGFDAPRSAADNGAVRRYLGDHDFPAACRVVPHRSFARLDAMTRLAPAGETWRQVTSCRVLDRLPGREHLEIRIPPSLESDLEVHPERAAASSRSVPDGDLELLLHVPEGGGAPADVELTAPVRLAGEPPWELPLPGFPGATQLARYLALPADASIQPQGAERIDPARIDSETRGWWRQVGVLDTDSVYRLSDEAVTLTEAPRRASGAPVVALLETVIHSVPGATTYGRTTLFLAGVRGGDEFQLALPVGATLVRAEAGALGLEVKSGDDQMVVGRLPAGARRASGRVVIDWQRPGAAALAVDEPYPRLVGTAPAREFVIVVPPRRVEYLPRAAQPLLGREVYLLERSEQMLELIGGHADPLRELSASLLAELSRDLDAQLDSLAEVAWREPALRRQYEHVRARWESLRAADGIASLAAAEAGAADHTRSGELASLLASGRAVVLQPAGAASPVARFWRVERRAARLAAGVALLAAVLLGWGAFWFARRRGRWRRPAAASIPEYAGLVLLGAMWWLWLSGSAIGLCLIAAGVLLQAARVVRVRGGVEPVSGGG